MKLGEDAFILTKHGEYIQTRILRLEEYSVYIIFSYGNAEDIDTATDWAKKYIIPNLKVNIVLYEYTGYAYGSNFSPKEEYVYNDVEAVYDYLTNTLNVPEKNIIMYGRSLGSGPSCFIAEKYVVGGLILVNGFSSILKVLGNFRFGFGIDKFENLKRIKRVDCPTFIIHCIKDEIVPFSHGLDLQKSAKNPWIPLYIDGIFHNETDKVMSLMLQKISEFLFSIYNINFKTKSNQTDFEGLVFSVGSKEYVLNTNDLNFETGAH